MKQKNKILQTIISEENQRKSKLEEIWSSLTDEDLLYMDNMELFKI